jgi:ribonuclease P protein component
LVDPAAADPPKGGFVVSRAVGDAVARNRVRRRLRHLVRPRLSALPPGSLLVVRALPAAADASSADLADDLDAALRRLDVGVGPGRARFLGAAGPVTSAGGTGTATLLP